ncbi:Intraflagellar transport protein 74 [Geranomyces variabilis]|uniref:Intraflagellar transport protein 74 n=1 Tax=Geranomyces variabilis TaxID=109894 RepID=A0AAD5XSS8_9FUNG|nr:Intraflagellar transport protein 74 [Geranomyces variabilis]
MYGRPPTGSLANRPSSRSGATSSWGGRGAGTAAGAKTRAGPPATGRPGTNMRGGFGYQVVDRPMTQQGLGGMRTGAQGPGRMIQDITYFQSELRQKISLLSAELARLNAEYDLLSKENANYASFERRADGLAGELRELQGTLGDFNTLVDKLHTDTDLEDIERHCQQLRVKNERDEIVLDDVFQERQAREAAVRDVESQIEAERARAEKQVAELDDTRRAIFLELKEENRTYTAEIAAKQAELAVLDNQAAELQEELQQEPVKLRALHLGEKVAELAKKKTEMEAHIKELEGESGPQEKSRLLQQVKEANQETSGMERKILELEDQAAKLKETLSGIDMELDSNQAEKNAKYEELLKRDRDMQAFLDSFEKRKADAEERNTGVEQTIVELLERMRSLVKPDTLPSPEVFHDLQGDLKFKEKEMRTSETTMEALIQERDRRLSDFEKVNSLETKMTAELEHLRTKVSNVRNELRKISDVESIKRDVEEAKERNEKERTQLLTLRDTLRYQVQQNLSAKHDAKKASLHENETAAQLATLEQRLRHIEGTNFHLKEYINTKNSESDYKGISKQVAALMDEVNQQIIRMKSVPPAR